MGGGEYRQRRVSRRISSGAATRTKLVLREKGKPVLTYQLGECIGRGQFGSVYRALNLNTGQVVAVKRISLEGKSENEVAELSNEVKLLRSLTHPAVVKYEGLVRTEHYLNIILEFAEGGSLEKTIKQYGQLPESLVAAYVLKMLEGLAYLHGEGVVHCDLKAANVLSTKNGNIKLSDFGVSLNLNALKTTRGLAAATEVNGTPNWMAPEVISMQGATAASDIWSLGATICELVSGRPPYADLVAMSAMFRIVEDDCPPLPDGISAELERFLLRCFRKNPQERPTADKLFEDPWLVKHSIGLQVRLSRPQDSIPFHRRISSDHRRPLLSLPATLSSAAAFTDDMSDSPVPLVPPVLPFALDEPAPRDSLDSGYRAEDEEVAVRMFQRIRFTQAC
ncbi:kinase-like domain-containing protein [Rhodotorula toruloides]